MKAVIVRCAYLLGAEVEHVDEFMNEDALYDVLLAGHVLTHDNLCRERDQTVSQGRTHGGPDSLGPTQTLEFQFFPVKLRHLDLRSKNSKDIRYKIHMGAPSKPAAW